MKKRGRKAQAGMIVTILIILIILAAIVILWNVVNRTVTESSSQIGVEPFLLKGNLEYVMYGNDGDGNYKNILIRVARGAGGGNISGIKIIFEGDTESYSYESNKYLGELETQEYIIRLSDVKDSSGISPTNFRDIKSISVHYIYENNKLTNSLEVEEVKEQVSSSKIGNIIWYVDSDNDGYGGVVCGESENCAPNNQDCDDNNAEINPSTSEIRNNGIDEDCDGYDNLNECGELTVPGDYILDNNLQVPLNVTASRCFYIKSDDITLDLNDKIIEGQTADGICNIEDLSECWNLRNSESCASNNICTWNGAWCTPICGNYYTQTSCESVGCIWYPREDNYRVIYYAIYINNYNNIKIRNGQIKNFITGIFLIKSESSNFENLGIGFDVPTTSNNLGVYLPFSNNNVFDGLSICGNFKYSFYSYNSNNNVFTSNTCDSSIILNPNSAPPPSCESSC